MDQLEGYPLEMCFLKKLCCSGRDCGNFKLLGVFSKILGMFLSFGLNMSGSSQKPDAVDFKSKKKKTMPRSSDGIAN